MDGRIRIACAAWLATLAAAGAMLPLIDGGEWLLRAGLLLTAQSAAGMLTRRRGVPAAVSVGAQLLVSLLLLTLACAREYAAAGLLPGPAVFDRFGRLITAGAEDIGNYPAPAPATDGIMLLVFGGVLLIGLLVDLLAVTLRSAAAAGLPLLALYSVAAGVARDDGGWPYFMIAAAGFLVLLLAEGRDRLGTWGRFFAGPGHGRQMTPHDHGRAAGPRTRAGRRIGALTLGVAVLAPSLLPSLGGGLFDLDGEDGSGPGGSASVTSVNPVVALQDQLNRPRNQRLLAYRTDSTQPSEMYLRLVALDEFDGEEWRSSGWHEPAPPAPPWPVFGLTSAVPRTGATTVIEAEETYRQPSLPVPYPAQSIGTDGDWLFDRGSQTLVAGDDEESTQGRTYEVEHLLVAPTAEQLANAPAPAPEIQEYYTQVPDDLPPEVRDTALDVTAGAANDYERGVALQTWFTRDGGFRYDTAVQSGSGTEAIVRFLQDREGFCVHFAFTMAAMARALGIPAQVAVGFTPGVRQADGSYEVGTHNAHAWPELYFEGVGWVRFEPTPGQGSQPPYTRPEAPAPGPDDPEETPEPEPSPSQTAPGPATSAPDPCDTQPGGECGDRPRTPEDAHDEAGWPVWPVMWTGGGLLAACLAAGPLLWRSRVRARRLLPDAGPLPAWRELLDSAWDHGITPLAWETPRQAAERVVRVAGLTGAPAEAVARVALAVEEELYAPHGARPERRLAHDVRTARAGLRAGAGRLARLRALLLPRSALRVTRTVTERRVAAAARLRTRLARPAARRPRRRA
ncbi:transglutaminase TgpA family protein [Streptomyces sp. URMC 129]|uniref:transglutaminase TgpA family protein n=1 Tax=Streptomyces sp. URMC 129 TaxID=3423407 RepID=UPI003F1999E5